MSSEPNTTDILPEEIGIGIDLGMTYSGAAIVSKFQGGLLDLEVVPIHGVRGSLKKFPTVVFVSRDKSVVAVGQDARMQEVEGKVYELFKRSLGTTWQDKDGIVPDAKFLVTQVLKAIKTDIDALLDERGYQSDKIKKRYAFSYPSTWQEGMHTALEAAITQAGFHKFAMVDEAIATAIGAVKTGRFHEIVGKQEVTFVCDFGGGTTDFALIQATPQGFVRMMHAVGGDELLGMSNLDKVIALLVAREMNMLQPSGARVLDQKTILGADLEAAWKEFEVSPAWKSQILMACEVLKRTAFENWQTFVADSLRSPDQQFIQITKEDLQPFVTAMLETIALDAGRYLKEVAERSGINSAQVRYLLVGGGGSALPGVSEKLSRLMPTAKVLQIDSETATSLVQRGAAFHALDPKIYDRRVANSYGVKTFRRDKPDRHVPETQISMGEDDEGHSVPYYPYYKVYLKRNKTIGSEPIKHSFNPIHADQESVEFEVLTGEHDDPANPKNERIGVLDLPLPPHASIHHSITCSFSINDRGLLEVTAVDDKTGKQIRKVFERKIDLLPE